MIQLVSVFILFHAPVPKSVYEGQIAVMLHGIHGTEMIILSPEGKEVRRVPFIDATGAMYSVKLAHGGEWALVSKSVQPIQIFNRRISTSAGYLVKLDGSAKPKVLFVRKGNLRWVFNRDATRVYGTEIDEEKSAKNPNLNIIINKAWNLDLKSGKFESLPLPADYSLIDITRDDKTVLTGTVVEGKYRTAISSITTWKPTFLADAKEYPHSISPDGKHLLLIGSLKNRRVMVLQDLATKERKTIIPPEECYSVTAFSYGADGTRIAFVGGTDDTGIYDRLYVCNTDGSNRKMIFEIKPGESISDIDWR